MLEITESLVLDPAVKPVVASLRALGVELALDDFGTGYSSLGSLQRFPLDLVKLDRTLIASLTETGPRSCAPPSNSAPRSLASSPKDRSPTQLERCASSAARSARATCSPDHSISTKRTASSKTPVAAANRCANRLREPSPPACGPRCHSTAGDRHIVGAGFGESSLRGLPESELRVALQHGHRSLRRVPSPSRPGRRPGARSATSIPREPDTRDSTVPGSERTRITRARVPPVSAARTGMRSSASSSRTAASLRRPISTNIGAGAAAPPTSTASIRPGSAPADRNALSSARTTQSATPAGEMLTVANISGSTTCARPATRTRRSRRATPMHDPSPRMTSSPP